MNRRPLLHGRESWWLDFVEGEMDPATRAEMRAVLRNSKIDNDLVQVLSETRKTLKEHEIALPEISDDFFEALHDKIMAKVEIAEIAPVQKYRIKAHHRKWVAATAATSAVVALTFTVFSFFSMKGLNTRWDVSQQIAQQAQENPDDLAVLMTYQNEHDFFVDVASLSADHLTREQFENLVKPTKTR